MDGFISRSRWAAVICERLIKQCGYGICNVGNGIRLREQEGKCISLNLSTISKLYHLGPLRIDHTKSAVRGRMHRARKAQSHDFRQPSIARQLTITILLGRSICDPLRYPIRYTQILPLSYQADLGYSFSLLNEDTPDVSYSAPV